jgi:hypothetical protein
MLDSYIKNYKNLNKSYKIKNDNFFESEFPKNCVMCEVKQQDSCGGKHLLGILHAATENHPLKFVSDWEKKQKMLELVGQDNYMDIQVIGSFLNNWMWISYGGSAHIFSLLPLKVLSLSDQGVFYDLARKISIARFGELGNIFPMISAGMHNFPLTKYLIQQASQSHEDRIEALKEYFPDANSDDWELVVAGKRVQIIKSDEKEGGVLEFGTEVVFAKDGTLAALLGASPGASTSVAIMLEVLVDCFSSKVSTTEWQTKLKEMIPSYGTSLHDNEELCRKSRIRTHKLLKLIPIEELQTSSV